MAIRSAFVAITMLAAVLASAPVQAQQSAPPGRFDYWVLSLSWSPTWCGGGRRAAADTQQCEAGTRRGFVVHGLWPQYQAGGYPVGCAVPRDVPAHVVDDMLPVMPSRSLVLREWARHGTCSGQSAEDYFAATRQAFAKIRIPEALKAPDQSVTLSPAAVRDAFVAANPGLPGQSLAVVCRGRLGAEVRVCLGRDLSFTACGRDVRDRCAGDAVFPKVR